jgi:hypothetical protein
VGVVFHDLLCLSSVKIALLMEKNYIEFFQKELVYGKILTIVNISSGRIQKGGLNNDHKNK